MPRKFLLFSGHNDRAVIALCRFFEQNGLDFCVAARATSDVITNSRYRDRIVFIRHTPELDMQLFADIMDAAGEDSLIYCPTTEFINLFILDYKEDLIALGYEIHLPSAELYHSITNKLSATAFFSSVAGLFVPEELQPETARAPCVAKPKQNLSKGKILYPQILRDPPELATFLDTHDPHAYFFQQYVGGSSLYFCGCLDRQGVWAGFWQRNLGQQPGGKSIVLAREEVDPPRDLIALENALITRLTTAGYFGPFMVEIRRHNARNYFIEINPRFWGPLQLAVDVCPKLLECFVRMALPRFSSTSKRNKLSPCYYVWKGGMIKWEQLERPDEISAVLSDQPAWDVFQRKDYEDVEML
ncbi:MAG: hypothetical protein QNI90_14115 [Dinoroseobacter sp.]|nr:hypothetical protein [Dinoroseobacter sp.]